ncbi:unnamed protein product, partial [Mesorhabditis spiculigera]
MEKSGIYLLILLFEAIPILEAASCKNSQYCPQHWQVLRRDDQSAYTCDPMRGQTKCPKPYQCIHSKCGIAFCCSHPGMLETWRREKELEEEILENEEDAEL